MAGADAGSEVASSVRLHHAVLAAALIVPAALFAAAAWQNYADVLREGHDAIERTAAILQEHARKVFETAELAIGEVDERIEGESWTAISSPANSDFLRRLKAPMDQLVSVWIADRDGNIRAGSQPWARGSNIAEREFFQVHRDAPRSLFISEPYRGMATARLSFALSWGLRTADGSFDGTIHVAISPTYFERFFAEASPPIDHSAVLLREDGTVLAAGPDRGGPAVLPPTAPIMRQIAESPSRPLSSRADGDGTVQDLAVRRVGPYPVYVAFSVKRSVLIDRWYRNLLLYGAVAALAAAFLAGVSLLALRRAAAEQRALASLRKEVRQRQTAELQLRHVQRLEAVGQLTGGIAHDFNNLLTAILGNLELIQRASPPNDERIPRLTAMAIKAVRRGAALTKSLLAFSRKQPLQPVPLDANAVVGEFLGLVRQAVGPGVTVVFEPSAGLPICVADPAELEAAILNMAINARDAMAGRGRDARLVIRTEAVTLGAEALAVNAEAQPGLFVAIELADNGAGMSAEVIGKAFEPFFTTKPSGQGTGLGLSQVFGFVRQLGGHVTITSAPGEGAAVTLFLPVAERRADAPMAEVGAG